MTDTYKRPTASYWRAAAMRLTADALSNMTHDLWHSAGTALKQADEAMHLAAIADAREEASAEATAAKDAPAPLAAAAE